MNIRVLVYKPGSPAELQMIGDDLDSMQAVVGGYIEMVRLPIPGLVIICNEEGLLLNLPVNKMGIRGAFFVARSDESDLVSLSDDDVSTVTQLTSAAHQRPIASA